MIIRYSQVIHSPIIEIKTQSLLGKVLDIVLQKSDFSIKALLVKPSIFSFEKLVVTDADILEIVNNAVLVNDDNSISPLKDSPRVVQSIEAKAYGINQKVITKSGKVVGRVHDYTFDSQILKVINLYVKSLVSDRIIPSGSIHKFEKGKVIIDDDYEVAKVAETMTA